MLDELLQKVCDLPAVVGSADFEGLRAFRGAFASTVLNHPEEETYWIHRWHFDATCEEDGTVRAVPLYDHLPADFREVLESTAGHYFNHLGINKLYYGTDLVSEADVFALLKDLVAINAIVRAEDLLPPGLVAAITNIASFVVNSSGAVTPETMMAEFQRVVQSTSPEEILRWGQTLSTNAGVMDALLKTLLGKLAENGADLSVLNSAVGMPAGLSVSEAFSSMVAAFTACMRGGGGDDPSAAAGIPPGMGDMFRTAVASMMPAVSGSGGGVGSASASVGACAGAGRR
jgi:hypothetical protein